MFQKKHFFWSLLVLVHILFFLMQVKNNNLYLRDSYEYLEMSENIREDFYFYCGETEDIFEPDLLTKRPPLYPLFITIIKFIHKSDFLIIFFQSILSIFNIFVLIKIAKKFKINDYLLILILLIFTPSQFIYANLIMCEIVFQTFLILSFLHIVLFSESEKFKYLFFYNILLVFAMLTKPVLYLFSIPNLIFLIYVAFRKKDFKIPLTGLIPIIFILGYCGWNYKRTGYFHYSSIQKLSLLNYTTYYFLMNNKGEEFANKTIEEIDKKAEKISSYKKKNKYINKEISNILLKENLIPYSIFYLKGICNFFLDPGRFDIQNFSGFTRTKDKGLLYHYSKSGYRGIISYIKKQSVFLLLLLMLILFFNFLKLLGFILLFFNKKANIETRIFIFALVGYIALATGPSGASRFALPLLPLMIFSCLNSWDLCLSLNKTDFVKPQ